MKVKDRILKILNIRSDETKPVFLLMLFSFFVGLTVTFYFTASNAIFLKHFRSMMISVSYIISGIVVYAIWWILSRLDKKLSVPRQVIVKLLFILVTVLAISLGVWFFDTAWLSFVMFTWIRVLSYVILITFWGLAGNLFNLRQGKRVFGLIGIGEAVSIIIGYFSIPFFLQFLKAPDLLFLASFSLFICLITVLIILRNFGDQLQTKKTEKSDDQDETKPEWNYWKLVRKPYFFLISLMALLPIFGYLFVNFLFLAQTKLEFANNPEIIARFFGIFLGFVSIVELIFKLFSGNFLNKYGIKVCLLSLPFILGFSILIAAFFGTVYGTVGLFFAFVSMARLFERSVRGSVYEPAFQLLYQPLPSEQRLPFQNQIEGIPKALGTVITGAVLLGLAAIPFFNLVHFDYFFILVLGLWVWISFKMYEEYRNQIKSKLSDVKHEEKIDSEKEGGYIEKYLSSSDPMHFNRFYRFFEWIEPVGSENALKGTYMASTVPVRRVILEKIREQQNISALAFLQTLIARNPDPELQESLEKTIHLLKEAEDLPFDHLMELARSEEVENRIRAVRLLGYSGRYNTYKLLLNLLNDPEPAVKKAALISAGKIKRFELWPYLIENLAYPEYSNAAMMAIILIGEPILKEVDHFFNKTGEKKAVLLRIIRLYELIGSETAIRLLRAKISYPDKDIRYVVLSALSTLSYHATVTEVSFIKQAIEETVETMVWIMASLIDIGGSIETMNIQDSLMREMEEKKEYFFLLLSMLYESKTIRHIRENIESPDKNAKIYALEVCDMTVSEEIKELFIPLFEDIPLHERLSHFNLRFPQEKLTLHERLNDIINKDYTKINNWTKACAFEILGNPDLDVPGETAMLLAANMMNPDILISEMACWALFNLDRDYFTGTMKRFEKKDADGSAEIIREMTARKNNKITLLFETVLKLKNSALFAPMTDMVLVELARSICHDLPGTRPDTEPIKKVLQTGLSLPDDLAKLGIPAEKLFELMSGNRMLTERFISLYMNHSYLKEGL